MKYIIYPFAMLFYVIYTLCLSIAYFFMVFISTLSDAHNTSLEACENTRDWLKILKVWTKKGNDLDKD